METRVRFARRFGRWVLFLASFLSASGGFADVNRWEPLGPFGGWATTLAVDPLRPQVVYVGTQGGGVFKSGSRASSWKAASLGLGDGHINALVLDPSNPDKVLAATWAGLYRSENGGKDWFSLGHGLGKGGVRAVAIDPSDSFHVLAVGERGLFWSHDGGVTFAQVPGWRWGSLVKAIRFAPSDPRVVYATGFFGVVKSVDGGWNWRLTKLTEPAMYDIAVHPRNPDVVYAGGYRGLFTSTNGGETWVTAGDGLEGQPVLCLARAPSSENTLYAGTPRGVYKSENGGARWYRSNLGMQGAWIEALAVDPLNRDVAYAAAGDGVYRTTNGAKSWEKVVQGLAATTVEALAVDPINPATIYCISEENGLVKTTDGGRSWSQVRRLEGGQQGLELRVDPQDPRTVYAAVRGLGVIKSTDGGASWFLTTPQQLTYLTAFTLDPQNPQNLYSAAGTRLFASFDGGESWEELSQVPLEWDEGSSRLPEVSVLAVHPQRPHLLFAGGSNGEIFRSTNGGNGWMVAQLPEERGAVSSIAFNPENPERMYAATTWGLWFSNDGGQSFTVVPGLGNAPLTSVVFAGHRGELLLVGTFYAGVAISFDGGQTWVSLKTGLTSPSVKKLLAEPQRPLSLLAATKGGGVFELSLANPPRRVLRPRHGEGP